MARFAVLSCLLLAACAAGATVQDSESSCGSGAPAEGTKSGSCMIQARSGAAPALSRVPVGLDELSPTPARLTVPAGLDELSPTAGLALAAVKGQKKIELPEDLKKLGIEMFKSEEALNEIVANSEEISATVFDKKLTLRIKKGDNAISRLPDEGKTDEYGIKEILDEGPTAHGMINVIDMGANYGIVPIALFHTYPKFVRAVIAEPIPQTYFFLRWNLKLNNVPELTEEEIKATGKERTPGVLAIHQGVAEDDKDMSFCWAKNNSMNAMMCDCKRPPFPSECLKVKTISTMSLLSLFGESGVDFLKMDCEGCELHSLPALDKLDKGTTLVRRLVGELHEVPPKIEDIACKFTHKTWMTKVCAQPRGAGQQLECDPKTRDEKCYVPVPWPRP
mmetsp:Transcript_35609/g.64026  ORF Transcript_35609/g.64026 Transcript_35609/m.64026 type:complete len:392 (-) Transcript_35609:104-1279(-)